ncbi:MAG: SDR family oxidoreductase [Polyangiaceae bacterium]
MGRALDLRRKTALVTGASSGIGREIAKVLARDVATLVLVARRRDRLEELAGELSAAHPALRVRICDVDLTDRGAAARMLDALDDEGIAIDVLVNNAGFGDRGLLNERPWSKIEALLELNVVGATYLLHRLLPGMIERGYGGVLNIGSVAGIVSKPGSAVYGASKSYLNALSEALAAEVRGTGVVVTAVLPGPVPTEFGVMASKSEASPVENAGAEAGAPGRSFKMPRVLFVSAEDCAEQSVRALVEGRARVVPGGAMRAAAAVMDNLPRVVWRQILGRAARKMRGE